MLRYVLRYAYEHRVQLAKFTLVGITTFGINFLAFHLFYGVAGLDYRVAVSFAYVITVVSHFLLHRFFTFRAGEQQLIHNAGKYLLMLALNYAITVTVAWVVVEVIRISPYFGVIASTGVTALTSFFVMKYFVFGSRRAQWRLS